MFLHTFHIPGLAVNTYLVGDYDTKRAALIDPTRDIEPYLQYAKEEGVEITDIVETHVHADFVSGSKELKHRLNGRPTIHCSSQGGEAWIPSYVDEKVVDGQTIILGSIHLEALHTPGHTPEHLIWLCYDDSRSKQTPCLVFTGDLLFVGSVGRPDLLGKEAIEPLAGQLYHSLFVKMEKLPDFLELFPAHGAGSLCGKGLSARPSSTLGYERRFNPFFVKQPLDKLIQALQKDTPSAPPNFQRLKKINVQGPSLMSENPLTDKKPSFIVDVRSPQKFAQVHIQGAVNVPLGHSFYNWAGAVIPGEVAIVIVGEDAEELKKARENLSLIGFDCIDKELDWRKVAGNKEYPLETLPVYSVQDLAEKIRTKPKLYVLDVRTPVEWKAGHIKDAHHLELAQLSDKINEIPNTESLYVICGSGYRSSVAASFLKQKGYKDVASIQGGMSAWQHAKLPVEESLHHG